MRNFRGNMWFVLVSFIFLALVTTTFIMTVIAMLLMHYKLLAVIVPLGTFSVVAFALVSIGVGTLTSTIFGRIFVSPIRRLSAAMKRVSKGDFSVQLENDSINEVGQLTRDFNKMVRDLGSIETLRNDFVTNVSHEFKTPIASIEGLATLLQDETLSDAERREYAKLIAASAQKLSVLTSNILRLSKLENQEFVTEQSTFSLDEQIRLAILMLEAQWSGKNIELNIDLAPVTIFSCEELLLQVWLNILGNAIKFTESGGTIAVTLHDLGKTASVTMQDNGCGMSDSVKAHIFDKFYQGDPAHSHQGNGLGLSLVHRILDLLGGQIQVDSAPGEGSTFTVHLKKNN